MIPVKINCCKANLFRTLEQKKSNDIFSQFIEYLLSMKYDEKKRLKWEGEGGKVLGQRKNTFSHLADSTNLKKFNEEVDLFIQLSIHLY